MFLFQRPSPRGKRLRYVDGRVSVLFLQPAPWTRLHARIDSRKATCESGVSLSADRDSCLAPEVDVRTRHSPQEWSTAVLFDSQTLPVFGKIIQFLRLRFS